MKEDMSVRRRDSDSTCSASLLERETSLYCDEIPKKERSRSASGISAEKANSGVSNHALGRSTEMAEEGKKPSVLKEGWDTKEITSSSTACACADKGREGDGSSSDTSTIDLIFFFLASLTLLATACSGRRRSISVLQASILRSEEEGGRGGAEDDQETIDRLSEKDGEQRLQSATEEGAGVADRCDSESEPESLLTKDRVLLKSPWPCWSVADLF